MLTLLWTAVELDSPCISDMPEQEAADPSVGHRVPVDPVWHVVVEAVAEVKMQIHNIQANEICQLHTVDEAGIMTSLMS